MAPSVRLIGWNKGLNKVQLALAITKHGLRYSLKDASDSVIFLTNNEPVDIFFKDIKNAQEFAREAVEYGAKIEADTITIAQAR